MHYLLALSLIVLALPATAQTARTVQLTTPDKVELTLSYYPVSTDAAPAVILLHSRGKTRGEWAGIAAMLQRNGLAAVTFDLRGHGASRRQVKEDGPEVVDHRRFRAADYDKMVLDIHQVFEWLTDQPGIASNRIALVGTEIGATLALRYAVLNSDVRATVLISPGLVDQGLRTDDVITKYGKRPLLIVAARNDTFTFASAKRLIELRKEDGQTVEANEMIGCTGNARGTALFDVVQELTSTVFGWLERILQAPPVAP